MPVLRTVIVVEVDGVPLPGFPIAKRITLDDGVQFDFGQVTGGGAIALPLGKVDTTLKALIVRPDQQVTIATGALVLNAGGFIVIVDGALGTGAQATVANASGATAQVKGFGGGT